MDVRLASLSDFGAMLTLQRAAFVDEARLYETPFVPALDETLAELTERLEQCTSWVADDAGRIVGAVSLRQYRDGGPDIERLMVAPDRRGEGLSSQLLAVAERHALDTGHSQMQLIVGDLAKANQAIYRHLGWTLHHTESLDGYPHVIVHTMTKQLP